MRPGLISITFRKLKAAEIVSLSVETGLEGIEWGGDVHCPHGDVRTAGELAKMSSDAGLEVVSYGSYYKLGASESAGLAFGSVLDSAVALEAPRVRVWAGGKGSKASSPEDRAAVAADLDRIAGMAAKAGVKISLEYHLGTLTDVATSALALLRETGRDDILLQWQPVHDRSSAVNSAELESILGVLGNLHVFEWTVNGKKEVERRPLDEGMGHWPGWLKTAEKSPDCQWAMLEFVRDDSPDTLRADARSLRGMLKALR